MLPIYHLFLVIQTTSIVVNTYNTCQLQPKCDQTSVHCDNATHLCFCQSNQYMLLRTGVCLQTSTVNHRCVIYQSCINAKCITTDEIEVDFIDSVRKDSTFRLSLRESVIRRQEKLLAFCRCGASTSAEECNYKVIGRHCQHSGHCSRFVANSECRNDVCSCNQTHYHLDDTCLKKKNYDELCSESSECISKLYCRSAQCRCRRNYEFDVESGVCQYKPSNDANELNASNTSGNFWDDIAKVGGFVIIVVLMLFICTKKESELQNEALNGSTRRRHSTGARTHRKRSSSVNSHRPLTQTSSNGSRSSAYRTFEEPVPIRQTIIIPSPQQLVRSLSSSSDDIEYNPYQFDTLFPQQSDNDDPPSYEEVVKEMDSH